MSLQTICTHCSQCISETTVTHFSLSSALVRHSCSTHCRSCTAPAFTRLKNCQLCVTMNFPLPSFGSSRLTGNDTSADQTLVHTCGPSCTSYSWKFELVLTVNYSSCQTSATLTCRYSHTYPTFHPLFFPYGQQCQQSLAVWEDLGTSEAVGLGAEA